MQEEFDALVRNETWTLIPRSAEDDLTNVINVIWIFKVKQREDGSVERLKARLFANGVRQLEGVEYNQTFSLVVKPVSIRLVFTVAISKGWY